MKRWLGALAFFGATAVASSAMAQEIQIRGPLANAPSCRRCVQYRAGRFVLAPSFGISLQDDFNRSMFTGLQGTYFFNDLIGLGFYAGYAPIQIPTSLANAVQTYDYTNAEAMAMGASFTPTHNVPTQAGFNQQTGRIEMLIGLPQLTLTPLRGKLALFQNVFLDADFYIFAGPAIALVSERADFDALQPNGSIATPTDTETTTNQTARSRRIQFTGTFGAGLNFYINRFISISFEYRAYPFAWNTSGTDENTTARTCGGDGMQACNGSPDYLVQPANAVATANMPGGRFILDSNDRSFRFNQMINFSINIFLPPSPRIAD